MDEERRRILDMLAADKITVDQAEALLRALQAGDVRPPRPPAPPRDVPEGRRARSLRIQITEDGASSNSNVNVTVPIGLIRFAGRFLPKEARSQLNDNGIQFDQLIDSLNSEEGIMAGETLVEIDADGANGTTSHIHIKAV